MPQLLAILNALRLAIQRDLGTFASIKLNNFFLFLALMVYGEFQSGVKPEASEPLMLLLALLMLFPLSSDPLAKIPLERLNLWPLDSKQRWALRLASFALTPIFWIVLVLLLRKVGFVTALSFLSLSVAMRGLTVTGKRVNFLRYVPQPPGRLGGLIRNHIRETLCLLDTYVAVLLSVGGGIYRLSGRADPSAFPVLALLVALALSTYTQSLSGLDSGSSLTRYRLLPLRGWEILLAKDLAFLGLLMLLVLWLSPLCGLAAGFAVLALGHRSAALLHLPQRRWRFTSARILPVGILQTIACFVFGLGEQQRGIVVLIVAVLGYAVSLWWYGRLWERKMQETS